MLLGGFKVDCGSVWVGLGFGIVGRCAKPPKSAENPRNHIPNKTSAKLAAT